MCTIPAIFCAAVLSVSPASATEKGSLPRIAIDGRFDDWAGVPVTFADPTGDGNKSSTDILSVRLANDDGHIYICVEFADAVNLSALATPLRLYFNTDPSAGSGQQISGMGSDLAILFPEARVVEQSAEKLEAAVVPTAESGLAWEPTFTSKRVEIRLSRKAAFPKRGGSIFAKDQFDILLAGLKAEGETSEWAPDGANAYTYRFATGPLTPRQTISIGKGDPRHVRLLDWNVEWDSLFSNPEQADRVLRALQPDVICLQGMRRLTEHLRQKLDAALPLPDGGKWVAHKQGFSVVAARWALSRANFATMFPTGWGQAMVQIDLPDGQYKYDMYAISSHYKGGGQTNSSTDRQRQIQSDANVQWFRDLREPGGEISLEPGTPIVLCGNLNVVGSPQVLDTLVTGKVVNQIMYGPDSPPDWDGSPLADLCPLHIGAPLAYTWHGEEPQFAPGRVDYVLYTDSVMRVANSFVLDTTELSEAALAAACLQREDTTKASDHLPLVVDFELISSRPNHHSGSQPGAATSSPR